MNYSRIITILPCFVSLTLELKTTPSSQHSCFAALAKNSRLWTVFTVLRTAASRPLHKGGKILSAIAVLFVRKVRALRKVERRDEGVPPYRSLIRC